MRLFGKCATRRLSHECQGSETTTAEVSLGETQERYRVPVFQLLYTYINNPRSGCPRSLVRVPNSRKRPAIANESTFLQACVCSFALVLMHLLDALVLFAYSAC